MEKIKNWEGEKESYRLLIEEMRQIWGNDLMENDLDDLEGQRSFSWTVFDNMKVEHKVWSVYLT